MDYQINSAELTEYILELQFGDQTQNTDATKILRNLNFIIACNIWLFIHDENDEDNQWNMILSLDDDEKDIASIHLNQSHHQYKATKYKVKNYNSLTKTICRIPKALKIGLKTSINQTTSSAECILVGSILVIVSHISITKNVLSTIPSLPPKKAAQCAAASSLRIPLWACVSLAGGALGGAVAIAAVPIQTVGTAGIYMYNGTNTNDVINWKEWTAIVPTFQQLINWCYNQYSKPPSFKKKYSLDERKRESQRILNKYPDRIPVICEPNAVIYEELRWNLKEEELKQLKTKYLPPADLTVGQMAYVIRKRIKLAPEKAIFVFIDNILPSMAAFMLSIYVDHKDEDGFLYVTYETENCYGGCKQT